MLSLAKGWARLGKGVCSAMQVLPLSFSSVRDNLEKETAVHRSYWGVRIFMQVGSGNQFAPSALRFSWLSSLAGPAVLPYRKGSVALHRSVGLRCGACTGVEARTPHTQRGCIAGAIMQCFALLLRNLQVRFNLLCPHPIPNLCQGKR